MKINLALTLLLISLLSFNNALGQELKNFSTNTRAAKRLSANLEKYNEQSNQFLNQLEQQGNLDCLNPYEQRVEEDSVKHSLEVSYYSLEDDKEFLMGQPEVAVWSQEIRKVKLLQSKNDLQTQELTRLRGCISDPKYLKRIDKLLARHDHLTEKAIGTIEKEKGRLQSFVKRHPKAQVLQDQSKQLKAIERQQAKTPVQVQTTEMVLDKMAGNLGLSKEEAAKLVGQKLADASGQIQEGQQLATDALSSDAYARKTLNEKLIPGFDFSFNNSSPLTLDGIVNLGYQVRPRIVLGLGLNHRLALGQSWEQIDIKRFGWGYRAFIDYDIWKNLFVEGAFERFNGGIIEDNLQTESNSNTWRESFLIGFGVNQVIGQKGVFSTTLMYRLNNNNTQFPNPWIIRMGFKISKK